MSKDETDQKTAGARFNAANIGAIAVAVLVVIGIGVAMLIPHEPDDATAYEISKRERKIEMLTEENTQLKRDLHDLRDDYARMVAERRCEVIDGMDDCLAAGLTRPERFRVSDAALVKAREAEKARKLAEAAKKPDVPAAGAGQHGGDEESGFASLLRALKGIPGVKTE